MIWSFSSSRTFRRCQREWYFRSHVANAIARDPIRHEAYLLSKLQSIPAWRGDLVDHVISRRVIPTLKNKWSLNPARIRKDARETFEQQLAFARQHRLREAGMSPTKAGDAFAAFMDIQYGVEVGEDKLTQAWQDIELALNNLFQMQELLTLLGSASDLIPQRPLSFSQDGITVRAVPDVIAFFSSAPPLIVDWKVHTYGTHDYRLQLMCYALALTRCKPHKDFSPSLSRYAATDIRLIEIQLLTNRQREYHLSDADVAAVETHITHSADQMALAIGDCSNGELSAFDFAVAQNPDACQRCPFRLLCWEEET